MALSREERSWVLYDWANSAYSMIITVGIFPIFFKSYIAQDFDGVTSTAMFAYANTGAALVTALFAPILGALADHKDAKKRLFLAFFTGGIISTLALTLPDRGDVLLCLVLYACTHIGFYGGVIFYDAFLVDVARPERRDWISSLAFGWGYIGGVLPFLLAIAVIIFSDKLGFSSTVVPTRLSFVLCVVWWGVFSIPFIRNVKQKFYVQTTEPILKESFGRLYRTLSEAARHRNIFLFLLAFFLYIDGVHTIIKLATSYGLDIGLNQNALIGALVLVQIIAFPSAILYGWAARVFGAKGPLLFGVATYTLITIYAPFVSTAPQYFVMAAAVGSAQGGVQSLSRSIYSRLIPEANSAEFFGFYDIFGKFATVLGPALVGIIGQATGETRWGVLSLIVLFVLGASLLCFVRVPHSAVDSENAGESS